MKTLYLFHVLLLSFLQLDASTFIQQSKDTLVVSFISIGSGIDYKAKEKLDLLVQDFQNTQHVQVQVKVTHWGREGETDYTYNLKNLSKKQCKVFIEKIEDMFQENNRVKILQSSVN